MVSVFCIKIALAFGKNCLHPAGLNKSLTPEIDLSGVRRVLRIWNQSRFQVYFKV